jgi:hypothetical protein
VSSVVVVELALLIGHGVTNVTVVARKAKLLAKH